MPEPEDELDDERDDSIDMTGDFMDSMFRRIPNYTVDDQRDSKSCREINKLLPDVVEKTVNNMRSHSRRSTWNWLMPQPWYEGYSDWDNLPNQTEPYKQQLVIKLSLAWFLNGRRFIYRSLNFRNKIKEDKRYKIGFLFYALRRNVYDQHKLLQGLQSEEERDQWMNFETSLMVYTKIVRLNVDMNDIISYIRLLHYHQPDPPLKSDWLFRNKLKKEKRKPDQYTKT